MQPVSNATEGQVPLRGRGGWGGVLRTFPCVIEEREVSSFLRRKMACAKLTMIESSLDKKDQPRGSRTSALARLWRPSCSALVGSEV